MEIEHSIQQAGSNFVHFTSTLCSKHLAMELGVMHFVASFCVELTHSHLDTLLINFEISHESKTTLTTFQVKNWEEQLIVEMWFIR